MTVSVDCTTLGRQDAEGAFLRELLLAFGLKVMPGHKNTFGWLNQHFVFDAAGKPLARKTNDQLRELRPALEKALAEFQPPADVPDVRLDKVDQRHMPAPPEGGLVVKVFMTSLAGEDGRPGWSKYGRDLLWLRADEVRALTQGEFPQSLARRMARFHLFDSIGFKVWYPDIWREDEIEKLDLTLKDGRVSGSVRLKMAPRRFYDAKVQGRVEVRDGRVTKFDVVAMGPYSREDKGRGAVGRAGEVHTLGVAFVLCDPDDPARRVPPVGAEDGHVADYLGLTTEPVPDPSGKAEKKR